MVRNLILGTMKSAKSAQLIMKGYTLDSQGKKVLTFKPETDTRDGAFVSSRALPIKRPAIVIPKDCSGESMLWEVYLKQPSTILIDELQFFTVEQIDMIANISINYDIDIYAYGLMIAYNGKMFDAIKRAMECGFKITSLDMSCDHCNDNATHHLLYLNGELQTDGEPISVEDFQNKQQQYESVCFNCYLNAIHKYNK